MVPLCPYVSVVPSIASNSLAKPRTVAACGAIPFRRFLFFHSRAEPDNRNTVWKIKLLKRTSHLKSQRRFDSTTSGKRFTPMLPGSISAPERTTRACRLTAMPKASADLALPRRSCKPWRNGSKTAGSKPSPWKRPGFTGLPPFRYWKTRLPGGVGQPSADQKRHRQKERCAGLPVDPEATHLRLAQRFIPARRPVLYRPQLRAA